MTGNESNWQNELGFTTPKYVISKVLEKDQRFYPVSVKVMSKLRTAAKPIVKAMSVLFGNAQTDQAETTRQIVSDQMIVADDGKGNRNEATGQDVEIIREAIDPKLAKMRSEERKEAVEGVFHGLLEEQNLQVVAEIIMDSMRDVFKDPPPASEFLTATPVPVLFEMIQGVVAANAGVVGPLQGKLKGLVGKALDKATAKIDGSEEETDPAESESESEG